MDRGPGMGTHVYMEQRQNTKLLIPLPIWPSGREEGPPLHMRELQQVGHHIMMAQTHALGQPRGTRAIHQERQVRLRVHPRARIPPGIASAANTPVVPGHTGGIPAVANQHDPPLPDPGPTTRLPRRRQELRLRHQRPGPAVAQLPRELLGRVERVSGRHHAARPQAA